MSKRKFPSSIKSLLHFDELCKDEIGYLSWTAKVVSVGNIKKFGDGSLRSDAFLVSDANDNIWNLNSNGIYEIEFFLYPTDTKNIRPLFCIYASTANLLELALRGKGTLQFRSDSWGYPFASPVSGTTVLTINEWYHIMLRISNKTAKVFLNGIEEISIDLPEDVFLSTKTKPAEARIGYNTGVNNQYSYYIDEFLFRHSANTEAPTIPTSPYNYRSNAPVTHVLWQCDNLPAGLTLSPDGKLFGRPTATGSYTCLVRVTTNWGSATKTINIRVTE